MPEVEFIVQLVLAFSTDSFFLVWKGKKGWCFPLTSHTVACRLLLLWSVMIILPFFSGQNVFLTIKVKRYKLRGLFHYLFDVQAAQEKVGQVKPANYFEFEPLEGL